MYKTIILGIVQGIGEFLPISSSAHLILIPYLFNWNESLLSYDIALHFGTMLAVVLLFFKEWFKLLKGAFLFITKRKKSLENKMFWYLLVATIPGAIIGFLIDNYIENIFRSNIGLIAIFLAVMGVLIYLSDAWAAKSYKEEIEFEKINIKHAIIIGLSQSLAVIPGFSRSGTTILAARLLGLSRNAATKFTFLLSVPIILGANILEINNMSLTTYTLVGVLVSFLVGILSIKFLINYIKKHDFKIFAIYRLIFANIILIKYLFF